MLELDVCCGSGEANPGFLKTNATGGCLAYHTGSIKRICMATGHYPFWTSGGFTVKRRKLSWFGHVCRHDALPKIIAQRTVDGWRHRGRPRKSWKHNIKEWTGQLMLSLLHIAADRSRWAVITASVEVPPTTPGRHRY